MAQNNALNNKSSTFTVDNLLTVSAGGATIAGNSTINAGTVGIGTDATDNAISIATVANAGRLLTLGNTTGTSATVIQSGSGGTSLVGYTGIVTANNASPITVSTVTQYGAVIAGASNSVTSVAPSATSGVPLISQGSSANPTFGTAVVAGGGTGNTTFTAYSVICAGTTATGSFQNVSGVGTSGQVLTSNGAGTLPSWQAAAAGGVTTITGDSGSVTGATISLTGGLAAGAGATVRFVGSGTAMTFNVTNAQNTMIGQNCGNVTLSGIRNTIIGSNGNGAVGIPGGALTTGSYNTIVTGAGGGSALTSGSFNSLFGYQCSTGTGSSNNVCIGASSGATGNYNVSIGQDAGSGTSTGNSYNVSIGYNTRSTTTDTNYIYINAGAATGSNTLRIGSGTGTGTQNLNTVYIHGITGRPTSTSGAVTFTDTTGNMGTVAGGAMTMNTGTNALSISSDASATTVNIATGAAAKTTTLGSTNSTSTTTINSGSGGIVMTGVAGVAVSNKNYVTINSSTGALGSEAAPPSACSFNAVLASNSSRSAGLATVIFGTQDFQNGSAYSTVTGIFTAPATGIYTFSYSLDAYLGSASDYAGFNVNNGTYYTLSRFTNSAATNFVNFSGTITLSLSASDTVRIYYSSASGSSVIQGSGQYQSYFCGYRVA